MKVHLKELEVLDLGSNKIEKIENLDALQQLKKLSLQGNGIKKIENLDALENLEELYLTHNEISDIEGLESLNKLTTLNLDSNSPLQDKLEVSSKKFIEMTQLLETFNWPKKATFFLSIPISVHSYPYIVDMGSVQKASPYPAKYIYGVDKTTHYFPVYYTCEFPPPPKSEKEAANSAVLILKSFRDKEYVFFTDYTPEELEEWKRIIRYKDLDWDLLLKPTVSKKGDLFAVILYCTTLEKVCKFKFLLSTAHYSMTEEVIK